MLLQLHLIEYGLGDIVVASPVRRSLGIGELVHEVAAELIREAVAFRDHLRRILHQAAFASVELDQPDLLGRCGRWHDRDERQADQPGEIGLETAVEPDEASITGCPSRSQLLQRA